MTVSSTILEEVGAVLGDLVALPSVNPEGGGGSGEIHGESRVADYVESFAVRVGLEVERQPVHPNGRDNVILRAPSAGAAAPLLLEAHMDTVGVEGMEHPFVPRVEAGRLHGRGSCDTKASLAAMLVALRRAVAAAPLPRPVWLLAAVDEEYQQTGIRRFVESAPELCGAIVGEPTGLAVVSSHKGQLYQRILVRGRAAHTSVPERGENAIYLAADLVRSLRERAASELPARAHALCGSPLLTVSLIRGGTSEHIVPDACELAFDRRTVPGESPESVLAELERWLEADLGPERFARIAIQPPHHAASPVETPPDHPLVTGLLGAFERVTGAVARATGVSYNTDAGALSGRGVSCVVFGPGEIGHAHTPTERVELGEVARAAEILERFLRQGLTAL
jgi:acetylornithine deacetylase/succinyl-diaminopimelate desuccinylase-like protein